MCDRVNQIEIIMKIEIRRATAGQKPILANLLELYTYDFTEFWDFDIGDNGFYGYEKLSLYWTNSNYVPYLIYVENKLAGFALIQKGSPISENTKVWDVSEFFILKKYKNRGIGTAAILKVWEQHKGSWQVRVLVENQRACSFWLQAIKKFIQEEPIITDLKIKEEDWIIYNLLSAS